MHKDTLEKIEGRIRATDSLSEARRKELLELLGTLKLEISELSKTHREDARAITAFADASLREATRAQQDPQLLNISLRGFSSSVTGFEQTHPRLVQIVNSISQTLANLGI
jgi:hypothetical protein